jgi:meiotically up-regulated gene 157 (Mug157) protein
LRRLVAGVINRQTRRVLKDPYANAFDKDDPKKFTRSWFAWANTIFGELVLKTFQERPHLLD